MITTLILRQQLQPVPHWEILVLWLVTLDYSGFIIHPRLSQQLRTKCRSDCVLKYNKITNTEQDAE